MVVPPAAFLAVLGALALLLLLRKPRLEPADRLRALRGLDGVWLVLMALIVPVLGLGLGSSCEGCPRVGTALLVIRVGVGVASAAFLASLLPVVPPRAALAVARAYVPVSLAVLVAGMEIAR